MDNKNIAILGLGLMGASLALALKKRGYAGKLIGYARREETRALALENGVVDAVYATASEAVKDADLIVACVPIWAITELIEEIMPSLKEGAIVTDVGSTKAALLEHVAPLFVDSSACFMGSHPIAGSEKTGIDAGNADLYDGRLTVVCPQEGVSDAVKALVIDVWKMAGSEVVEMTPDQHDKMLASTSHLPHMVAAVLARAVAKTDAEEKARFCGTGFKDTTRVASGSAEMWVDIIDSNRVALEDELDSFYAEMKGFIQILREGNQDDIRTWLEAAASDRDQMLHLNKFLKR